MLSFLFIHTPLYFFTESFWRDEAFTYLLAKKNIADLLVLTAKDFNPPLYYALVHFWIKVFGSSEIALRSISLLFYWLTIYCVYLFLVNILKTQSKRIWIYLLLAAINPIILYYAFEARMYTMLAFFATLSFYAFLRKNYRLFFIATVLGLYTHYFMLFVLFIQLIYQPRKQVFSYLAPFFLFIPWLLFVLRVKDFGSQAFWIAKASPQMFVQLIGTVYTGYDGGLRFYHTMITPLSLGLTFFLGAGIWYLKKAGVDKKLLICFCLWGIGIPLFTALISFFKPIFFPRYLIFSSVGLLILYIFILEHLPSKIRMVILLALFLITINFHTQQVANRKKSDLRRLLREIKYIAKPGDSVYVTSELDYFVAQYYFDENRVYVYGKDYDTIPDYVGKILMPREKFVSALPVYPKKAFVLVSDSEYMIYSIQ